MNSVTIKDLIQNELSGLFGYDITKELNDIIKCYNIYEGDDSDLVYDEHYSQDFDCTKKNHNFIKELINKQARFMFTHTPTVEVLSDDEDPTLTKYVNKILKQNKFSSKLLKAALDCSIGKRIAIKVGWDDKKQKIRLRFVSSLEFVYETAEDDSEDVTKVIFYYQINDRENKDDQRIFKQKYEMQNNKCYCEEGIFDGNGKLVQSLREMSYTGLNFMPIFIILNGGLSGDVKGESDVKDLMDDQKDYNRLDSGDTDALIKGMFESIYGIDVDEESASKIKKAPGMYYDIATDVAAKDEGGKAQIGILSNTFSYSEALEKKLSRVKTNMYSALDVPLVTPAELQGFITSGKGLKGLYWQQIIRCNGKMMEWIPALEWLVETIIQIAKIYDRQLSTSNDEYNIVITNKYALPDDKEGEIASDLLQVSTDAMSRKDFMIKWLEVTPEAADLILQQIVKEKQMLENNWANEGMSGVLGEE